MLQRILNKKILTPKIGSSTQRSASHGQGLSAMLIGQPLPPFKSNTSHFQTGQTLNCLPTATGALLRLALPGIP